MNYLDDQDHVVAVDVIRAAHPNMSIPEGADLSDIGYRRILPAIEIPEPGEGQIVVQRSPQLIAGQWREVFAVEPAPVVVPQQITRAQGKATLIKTGRWSAILAYVDTISDPTEKAMAQVALHDTLTWQRTSPFLTTAAGALGMTSEQLDDLFVTASGIQL